MRLKRWLGVLTIALALLVWTNAHAVFAAAVPDKGKGFIQDGAKMIDDDKLAELEKAAQAGQFQFYLLSVNSLNGEDSAVFATRVHKAWEMADSDVLLVLAKSERRIEMNFHNPALQSAIDELPDDYDGNGNVGESKLNELVNRHFIPSAKQGDFAGAALSLMKAVNGLKLPEEPPVKQPDQPSAPSAGKAPTAEHAPGQGEVPGKNGSGAGGMSGTDGQVGSTPPAVTIPLREILTWLAVIAAAAAILAAAIVSAILTRRLSNQKTRIGVLMVEVERASGELKPFVGLVMGETERLVTSLDRELDALLVSVNQLRSGAEMMRISPLLYGKLNAAAKSLKNELDAAQGRLSELRVEINLIVEADVNVRKTTDELHLLLPEMRKRIEEAKAATSFPFTAVYQELERLGSKLEEADKQEVFDPIAGNATASKAWQDSEKLNGQIAAIAGYLDKYRSMPAVAADCREQIVRITAEHQIGKAVARLNPYALIEEARAAIEELYSKLQAGFLDEVASLAAEADRLLGEAIAVANRQAELKQLNGKDIGYLDSKQVSYVQNAVSLEGHWGRIRSQYAPGHWQQTFESYERMGRNIRKAEMSLPELKRLSGDEEQQYDRARELLDVLMAESRSADETIADCGRLFQELDDRLNRIKRQTDELQKQFERTILLAKRESLPWNDGWRQSSTVIEESYNKLTAWLRTPPFWLDELEAELRHFEGDVLSLQSQVNRKLEEKRDAERRMREAQAMYDKVYRRAGSRINRHHYDNNFGSLSQHTQQMIAAGMYAQAISEMAGLHKIVEQMNRDYRAAEEEERREAMARQQQSSGGSNWGSGGSNSSGGSSWGSSNGGDSNKGGNSSGGSNW
ncbi:TPM domain-containing protein [Paenibacillus sp. NPDC058071]|uniref:TPM domain-containing protein n=1 Tax=Paenibacillus sp. NPDC058071 TaxID=3346326 RepID=UPI0036DD88D5